MVGYATATLSARRNDSSMWRTIRISLLLLILFGVAFGAWFDQHRTTSWQHTVWVGVFPINADGSAAAAQYLEQLSADDYTTIDGFIAREAQRYGVTLAEPVVVRLYPALAVAPPALAADAEPFGRALWSLKLRRYRSQALGTIARARPQIALFLMFHDPERAEVLPHSRGLQRGLMGVVHLFASRAQREQNNIVIAHELLHTFGATDKYDADGAPRFPEGYAEPDRQPRYPQRYAELMAGRVPLSPATEVMPDGLAQVIIGPASAREIGWGKPR
jgi:hypothetical protein